MRVAIDIDSTLHNYWDQLADAARRRYGIELPYDNQVTWAIDRLEPDQLRACIAETHSDERILAAEPYPGAAEAISGWHAAGHEIHIASHRAEGAHGATARWLAREGIPFDELHCSFDKIAYCVERGMGLLIDDSPENLVRAHAVGIVPATIAHPWNRELCEAEGFLHADSWPELARVLVPVLTTRRAA